MPGSTVRDVLNRINALTNKEKLIKKLYQITCSTQLVFNCAQNFREAIDNICQKVTDDSETEGSLVQQIEEMDVRTAEQQKLPE